MQGRYGRFTIKVPGLFETVEDIMTMPIKVSGDSIIRVQDIAEIRSTYHDRTSFARHNGQPAVAVEIVKRTGENVIDTIAAVKEEIAQEQKFWPSNVQVNYSQDRSEDIKTMLKDLQNNVISAILLVMIIIVWALGLRSALLVGIAIPGAFLTGILFLFSSGMTVNMVVLFALILSVGMLVDGAIVVTELADRKMSEGLHKKEAYAVASKRMAWPIIASTATTLCAFLPLLFWPGLDGEFMQFLPITLIAVLTASLAMALIFVPTLGAYIGKPGSSANAKTMEAITASEKGDVRQIGGWTGRYISLLDSALNHPAKIVCVALALLVGIQVVYAHYGKGEEYFPSIEPETAVFLIHARGNMSIYEQDALIREVEKRVIDIEGFETVYTRVGSNNRSGGDVAEDVIGQIQVDFIDWQSRPPAKEIIKKVRERTENIAGIRVETRTEQRGPEQGKDIEIQLTSRYPDKLNPAIDRLRDVLETEIGGLQDINDTRPLPGIEWEVKVDRAQAAKFGLDIGSIGNAIRLVTNGLKAGEYRPDYTDEEVDIVIRYPEDDRSLNDLAHIRIETPQGSIPISNFVSVVPQQKVSTITRVDQARSMSLFADTQEGINTNEKIEQIKTWLNNHQIDPDVRIEFKGQDEDQRESQEFLLKAFFIALFLMAVILLTQFNSFYSALLILTAVILSTIGVFFGLLVTGQAFSVVMTGVGVISLAGIVVNNNIVLIDTFDYINQSGNFDIRDTILRTGAQRLRPVLLTTVTTVLGLLPMVLQANIDFINRTIEIGAPSTQWWVQLATAVVFGLVFSTVLTLIVTPSLLMMRANVSQWIRKKKA